MGGRERGGREKLEEIISNDNKDIKKNKTRKKEYFLPRERIGLGQIAQIYPIRIIIAPT